ncbi:MAG: FecR family protein [Nanoarchaeota archaeon]|nr:FecR family protein [Nanoarchaeota archaeon]
MLKRGLNKVSIIFLLIFIFSIVGVSVSATQEGAKIGDACRANATKYSGEIGVVDKKWDGGLRCFKDGHWGIYGSTAWELVNPEIKCPEDYQLKDGLCYLIDDNKNISTDVDSEEVTPELSVTISGINGEVEVMRNGEWIPAKKGMELKVDDLIATSVSSDVILKYSDGSTIRIKEVTQLEISRLTKDKQKAIRTLLRMRSGKIEAKVHREAGIDSNFEVSTPTSLLSVRGTIFSVEYDEETKETIVSVEDGKVSVTDENGNGEVIVNANEFTSVADSSLPEQPTSNNQIPNDLTNDDENPNNFIIGLVTIFIIIGLIITVVVLIMKRKK